MMVRIDAESVEAIARRVVELLRDERHVGLIDAAELAQRLGTSRSWVYDNAAQLGVLRVGRALRFDPAVIDRLESPSKGVEAASPPTSPRARPRRRPDTAATTPAGTPLLPIGSKMGTA